MNWKKLHTLDQLNEVKEQSKDKNVLIFKHSTRCSISSMALRRLERSWDETETQHIEPYYLDLIENRDISNEIQNTFRVVHASPQVLLIKDENCVYDSSHMDINYDAIKSLN